MKKIVIDGHNLIPKVPGINLSDMDDESKLIQMVGEYCRLSRTRAELFFDAAPGGSRSKHGLVNIHYVKKGTTADDAIIRYLQREGNAARNLQVISSDHRVQAEVRALRSEVISSDQFSRHMSETLAFSRSGESERETPPSEAEVEEMLKLMSKKRGS